MLRLLEQPSKTVSGVTYKYNASNNLVRMTLRREDVGLLSAQSSSGKTLLYLAAPYTFTTGDMVYCYFTQQLYTSGVYEVLSQPGPSTVEIDMPYVVASVGGNAYINNLTTKPNSHVKAKVYVNGAYAVELIAHTATDGTAYIDLGGVVNTFVNYYHNYSYSLIIEPNRNISGKFSVQVAEGWDDYEPPSYTTYGDYYYVGAVMQVLYEDDENMRPYTPYNNVNSRAKFLCEFGRPTYFKGYPYDLSFIYSDNLQYMIVSREEDRLNAAGGLESHLSTNVSNSGLRYVNRIKPVGGYTLPVSQIDFWLGAVPSGGGSFDRDFDFSYDTIDE